MTGRVVCLALVLVAMLQRPAAAHIGSPDVFLDGQAGPYKLYVTVRPPRAIPGVADVEILSTADDVDEIRIVPLPLTGPGAEFAPVPDTAERSPEDRRLFTGHLWMMTAGSWQVRVTATGPRGTGTLSVPVPTLPKSTLAMGRPLGILLFGLMIVLCLGFVAIASALWREARLEPGEAPGRAAERRGRVAGSVAAVIVVTLVVFGNRWWGAEAASYSRYVYKPLEATAVISDVAVPSRLRVTLRDPGWLRGRRLDDLVPDHGHLMHLFVLTPDLERLWHLHPRQIAPGEFEQPLPDLPAGRYELFADIVHKTGVPETVTTTFDTPATRGAPPGNDDAVYPAPARGTIVWVRDARPLTTKRLTVFTFRVDDESGKPASDLELYMGMPGHAVFVRRDRRVFAHVHPTGSAPMAAIEIASRSTPVHAHVENALPSTVSFPYGFPEAGDYRIFVQVKRAGHILTGAFDTHVD